MDLLDDNHLVFDVEHRILEEVFKKPALYNIRLDLKYRTPELKQSLFNGIAELLNDEFDLSLNWKVIENTFDDLRAKYIRYTNALKLPSGSGANRMPAKPKHYDILRQNDILKDRREQVSTLSAEGFELQPPRGRNNKTEKPAEKEFEVFLKSANQYFDNLNNRSNQTATSSEIARRELTSVCSITTFPINCDPDVTFLLTILPSMKELPKAQKRKFQYEVMGKLNDELDRCENNKSFRSEHQDYQQSDNDDE